MDRLTTRKSDGSITIESATKIAGAFERLAAYEDIGLSPEEIENTLADFSAFLCYVTNGRMSKTNYTVEAMRSEADNCIMEMCNDCGERQFAEKYEKAEAEGRLIVLPCKVGDTVYTIEVFYEGGEWKKRIRDRKFNVSDVEKMGKWIFLSREEAEAALSKDGGQYDCT